MPKGTSRLAWRHGILVALSACKLLRLGVIMTLLSKEPPARSQVCKQPLTLWIVLAVNVLAALPVGA